MRKLVYFIASTVDGFIAGPDGADPTGPDGFWPIPQDYVAYLTAEYPETLPAPARAALGVTDPGTHFDTVVEGRNSYEVGLKAGIANAYPHLRHVVFSSTLRADPDSGVEVVSGDPAAAVRALKREEGKDIWLVGGGALAGSLYGEVDRLVVKLAAMTIGAGVPLFGRGARFEPRAWRLTHHHVFDSGAAFLTYDREAG
ncbi:dihydrofolate reductase family protein [Streptomonospora nanhaiensis]|uniref:Dihydrofolate reductase n=1 Tax=Streptomonospora nanhaiensis TaxID=1323731 RepID=A0A853BHW3_9ACTN|nr:dihydrofolate reductase family protein [Streptomonospora nanhaiensis]MBV2363191.1 dihydrofolate reductase family protein [Streptomonospora nanhaiensis]MBX9387465.1 dihydrofolate reductase family protein [Streptomonospora nanhaiensis]NYI94314.1 dihydrofolate reductase [Streptomonospora nanhaiensis]